MAKTCSKGKQCATEEDPMVVDNSGGEGSAGAFIQGSSKDGMVVNRGNDGGAES